MFGTITAVAIKVSLKLGNVPITTRDRIVQKSNEQEETEKATEQQREDNKKCTEIELHVIE